MIERGISRREAISMGFLFGVRAVFYPGNVLAQRNKEASGAQKEALLVTAGSLIHPAYFADNFQLIDAFVTGDSGGAGVVRANAVAEREGNTQPFGIAKLYGQDGELNETIIVNSDGDHSVINLNLLPNSPFTGKNGFWGIPEDLQKVTEAMYQISAPLNWRRETFYLSVPGVLLAWRIGESYDQVSGRRFEAKAWEGTNNITLRVRYDHVPMVIQLA